MAILVVAPLESYAWWLLPVDSAPTFPFARWPGVSLINPLAVRSVLELRGEERLTYFGAPPGSEGSLAVCSNVLCCIMPGDWETKHTDNDLFRTVWLEQVPEMLRQLRWSARSPVFPTRNEGGHMGGLPSGQEPAIVLPDCAEGGAIGGMDRGWVVTLENIQQAAGCAEGWEPPVYGWLLLDAILAWMSFDYKKSLILAAIAAETMADVILKREYERLLDEDRSNLRMRIVEQGTSNRGAVWLDPVYLALTDAQSAQRIRRLLHEAALYVLGRSLMLDKPELFDQILKLHATRNQIVHRGGAGYDTGGYFAHHRSVRNTLQAVIDLCGWLGEPARFALADTPLILDDWPSRKPTDQH